MKTNDFIASSSITARLRSIMTMVAFFFVLSFLAIYLSSVPFLDTIQKMNQTNLLINLTTQTIEALNIANQRVSKLSLTYNIKESHFSIKSSHRFLIERLKIAIEKASPFPEVEKALQASLVSAKKYENTIDRVFQIFSRTPEKITRRWQEELKASLIIANQFEIETRENLLKSQISLQNISQTSFDAIYNSRFVPLIVAIVLSTLFFSFVVIIGMSVTRRLTQSIQNLTHATDTVATGNLNHKAHILHTDEIGKLTHTFNEMVSSLRENRNFLNKTLDRMARLYNITGLFSEALLPEQVFRIILRHGMEDLKLKGCLVSLLSEDNSKINVVAFEGFPKHFEERWKNIHPNDNSHMAHVIKYNQPIFIESPQHIKDQYSELYSPVVQEYPCTAILPLDIAGSAVGALVFSFHESQKISEEERNFMLALARQCSQALHRAQLFNDAKEAVLARDEFLSIASHELKTPLTPLKLQLQGFIRQIKKGNNENLTEEKITKMIESSDRQISRLASLIEDLLDVSRITSGKLTLNPEKFNISEMLEDIVNHYSFELAKVHCEIKVESDRSLFGLLDKIRIEQVIINILTNAAKYAPGKPIDVKLTSTNNNWIKFCISDQGPGIAPDNLERIFDRFERIKDRDNVGGLGLGLYISKEIVTAHGGKIYVESELGNGSTFNIELPQKPLEESV